jgi:hypothetical protein
MAMDHRLLRSTMDHEPDMVVGSPEDDRLTATAHRCLSTVVGQGRAAMQSSPLARRGIRGIGGGGDNLVGASIGVRRSEAWGTNAGSVKWSGWGAPFIGPTRRAGVRSGRDSTGVEWIFLISSVSRKGKDGSTSGFGRGRGARSGIWFTQRR